jgi:hypothetical protein
MSDVFTFDLKGMDALKVRLNRVATRGLVDTNSYFKNFADLIMEDAKERFVPEDEGTLRETGKVSEVRKAQEGIEVSLSFGGGGAEPYAIAIHEHLSRFSPPSWQNTTVVFRKGGPKYLELPVMEHSRDMPGVASRIFLHLFTGVF